MTRGEIKRIEDKIFAEERAFHKKMSEGAKPSPFNVKSFMKSAEKMRKIWPSNNEECKPS